MGGIKVHDVAIAAIKISPETFKAGEDTKIIVTVENQGTFAEKNLSVKVSVNGEPVEEGRKITAIKSGDSIEVSFAWMPVSDANELVEIVVRVEEVESEVELDDNIKKVRYNYVYSTETDIVTLYKVFPPVHQWIALQAYNKLQDNSLFKNEIKQYLPIDSNSLYYDPSFYIGLINWYLTTDPIVLEALKVPDDPKIALIEGTWEEDLDVIRNGCFDSHYWDPDNNVGMNGCNSAFKDALEDRFAKALNFYRLNMLDQAYYWLGRTAHLLMDMSVPAHTLLDSHGFPTPTDLFYDDSYEDYTGLHYKEVHSGSLNTDVPSMQNLQAIPYPLPSSSDGRGDLAKLLYNLAQKSNDFDSDDVNGESKRFGNGKFRLARNVLKHGKVVSKVEYWDFDFTFSYGWYPSIKLRDMIQYNGDEDQNPFPDYDILQNSCEDSIYYYESFYNGINNTDNGVVVYYTDGTWEYFFNLDEITSDIFDEPLNPTNSTLAIFSFTSTEANSTFQCQLDNGGYTACTSPMTYTGLAEGSHTFYVKATDAAGNSDPTPASYAWTIDAAPPVTTANLSVYYNVPDNPYSGITCICRSKKNAAFTKRYLLKQTITKTCAVLCIKHLKRKIFVSLNQSKVFFVGCADGSSDLNCAERYQDII